MLKYLADEIAKKKDEYAALSSELRDTLERINSCESVLSESIATYEKTGQPHMIQSLPEALYNYRGYRGSMSFDVDVEVAASWWDISEHEMRVRPAHEIYCRSSIRPPQGERAIISLSDEIREFEEAVQHLQ